MITFVHHNMGQININEIGQFNFQTEHSTVTIFMRLAQRLCWEGLSFKLMDIDTQNLVDCFTFLPAEHLVDVSCFIAKPLQDVEHAKNLDRASDELHCSIAEELKTNQTVNAQLLWFLYHLCLMVLPQQIYDVRGPSYLGLTRSISWLLMPWLLTLPGYQQPWYWLCRIGRFLSYLRKDFNYLCHINVEKWHKM